MRTPAAKREREEAEADKPSARRVRKRDAHPAKRSDPEAEALAKVARCRCDLAAVQVQLVQPEPVAPSEAAPRLFGLVRRFLHESGCAAAARALLLAADARRSPTTVAEATETILQSRLRLVRVVAGWRAFAVAAGPLLGEGSCLDTGMEERVRTVLRYCVALSRLDPHQPRPTRRVAAQMLGVLAFACRDPEAVAATGQIQLSRPSAACRAFLEETGSVVAGWVADADTDGTAFMRRWARLQTLLADADFRDVPLNHKAEDTPSIAEVVWTDPESHAVLVVRPLFPKRGMICAARAFVSEA